MSDRKEEESSKGDSNHGDDMKSEGKNTLDEGVIAFGEWLMSAEDHSARCGPLSLRKIVNDEQFLLFDSTLNREVTVRMVGGVPVCSACLDDTDCMHIGFSICIAQMNRRNAL